MTSFLIAINPKGSTKLHFKRKHMLQCVYLGRKNSACIVPDTLSYKNMFNKLNNRIVWSEIPLSQVNKIKGKVKYVKHNGSICHFGCNNPKKGFVDRCTGYVSTAKIVSDYVSRMIYRKVI